jgi:hypothetical protein
MVKLKGRTAAMTGHTSHQAEDARVAQVCSVLVCLSS